MVSFRLEGRESKVPFPLDVDVKAMASSDVLFTPSKCAGQNS